MTDLPLSVLAVTVICRANSEDILLKINLIQLIEYFDILAFYPMVGNICNSLCDELKVAPALSTRLYCTISFPVCVTKIHTSFCEVLRFQPHNLIVWLPGNVFIGSFEFQGITGNERRKI